MNNGYSRPVPDITRQAWLIYAAAVASSIPTLWFYLVGEEGILVNSSLEMAQRGEWLRLWLYGVDATHGVFANWLIILVSSVVGWQHAPGVTRAIMIGSTALSALMLAFLAQQLTRNAAVAALAAAIAMTFGDILLYRGWLGYRDPLLAMMVSGAITGLWLAVASRRSAWLAATLLFTTAAFLTKGIIAYAFVSAAVLVFLCQREARYFLLKPLPVLLALATLAVPLLWAQWVGGDQSHNSRLASEIADKLIPLGIGAYFAKLITFPLETLLRLAPVSLLMLWSLRRARQSHIIEIITKDQMVTTALVISAVAYVPFWLAPQSHFRYVLPVLPLLALAFAVILCKIGDAFVHTALRWMWAMVALKFVLALVAFPFYQHQVRGENYALAARAVLQHATGFPLYSNDVSAAGLAVTAYMNMLRLPQRTLTFAPTQWDNGFTISNMPNAALGKTAALYPLGGDTLYLLCRGLACAAPAQY